MKLMQFQITDLRYLRGRNLFTDTQTYPMKRLSVDDRALSNKKQTNKQTNRLAYKKCKVLKSTLSIPVQFFFFPKRPSFGNQN